MPPETSPPARDTRSSRDLKAAWSGLDASSIMGVELLAGILTWAGIGYLADRWLGTFPWLFAVGAMVGFAAGLYLVYLRSERMDRAERARDRADVEVDGTGDDR